MINKLYELLNGIEYTRTIPKEAEQLAKDNGYLVILGGSDDLMYCYGAESYLADYQEHGCWGGNTLKNIEDKHLEHEAKQLGLEIYWCGTISDFTSEPNTKFRYPILKSIKNYNANKSGAFSYKVNDNIEYKNFLVYENKDDPVNIYCTGIIIKLPDNFTKG